MKCTNRRKLLDLYGERKMSHFLSFIIPCYNCAGTVGEAIESIYKQDLNIPFEIVCTDDDSKDSTREVLTCYQSKYSNLYVHYHSQNTGVYGGAAAANTCVVNSKGDLIFRLDSDNVLAPDSVNKLIKLLDRVGCDGAAFGELRYFSGNYKHKGSWFYKASNNICDIKHILSTGETPASSGNYLYTRKSFDRVGGYPNVGLDSFGFGFRQHATGGKIVVLPGTFYWHRLSPNSCWRHDEKRGVNGKYGATIFREFPELFTDETNSFLASSDCEKNFFKHLKNGRFKLKIE